MDRLLTPLLRRLGTIEPGEERPTLLAATYFFFALASYFILRAVRDAAGVAAGTGQLPWLFTGTLLTTLVMNPVYASVVARLPVRRFIPVVYRVFIALLLGFAAIIKYGPPSWEPWLGPAFWILTSIYSLFVPSVFWGFMADSFRPEQGKRLFGFISVGGTLGALAGAFLTSQLATVVGTPVLMVLSVLLLEAAVQAARRFPPSFRPESRARDEAQQPVGGGRRWPASRTCCGRRTCWGCACTCCCSPLAARCCTSSRRRSWGRATPTGRRGRRSWRPSTRWCRG